jgi:hypothetical protein
MLLPLLAAVAVVVPGCGGGGDGDGAGSTKATQVPAVTTLSAAGYKALTDFNSLSESDAAPATVARRCERIGPSAGFDEQVDAIREFCMTVADIGQASKDTGQCAKQSSDPVAVRRCIAGTLDQIAAYAADAITGAKAVAGAAHLGSGACRDYLLDERELTQFRSFSRTAKVVARTLRDQSASQARLEAATSRLEIAFRRFERAAGGGQEAERAKACAHA